MCSGKNPPFCSDPCLRPAFFEPDLCPIPPPVSWSCWQEKVKVIIINKLPRTPLYATSVTIKEPLGGGGVTWGYLDIWYLIFLGGVISDIWFWGGGGGVRYLIFDFLGGVILIFYFLGGLISDIWFFRGSNIWYLIVFHPPFFARPVLKTPIFSSCVRT